MVNLRSVLAVVALPLFATAVPLQSRSYEQLPGQTPSTGTEEDPSWCSYSVFSTETGITMGGDTSQVYCYIGHNTQYDGVHLQCRANGVWVKRPDIPCDTVYSDW